MSYHLTIATFKVQSCHEERVISEQWREVFAVPELACVYISSTGISGLPVSLCKMCFCFCDVIQVKAVLKRKEEEDQQVQQLIQALQASLEKEKSKVKDLKKQVMAYLLIYLLKR